MQPIIYDVAVSIDGYISGPNGNVSQFASDGPVVEDYMERLARYAVCIMGKRTYEFGYSYGLTPGQNPYGHMETLVFSHSIELPQDSAVKVHRTSDADRFRDLKSASGGLIYLCGGGAFAGSLLAMGLIDRLRLKRAPVILGGGVRLFDTVATANFTHVETRDYGNGYLLQEFEVTV